MILLIRHGESEANVSRIISEDYEKYPLTEKGMDQVRFAASQLKGISFTGIITSPVLRARQTASIIGEILGIEPVVDDRIRESGLGPLNNQYIPVIPRGKSRTDLKLESWDSHVGRFLSLINEKNGDYVFVSHGFPIRAIAGYYLGWNEFESAGVEIKNASMTVIDAEKGDVPALGSIVLTDRVKKMLMRD